MLVREVVALDDGDAGSTQAELCGQREDPLRRTARIRTSEVADDGDAVLQAVGEDGADLLDEQRLVTCVGIVAPGELRERKRALGEIFECDHASAPGGDHRVDDRSRGIGAITGAARGIAHPEVFHR